MFSVYKIIPALFFMFCCCYKSTAQPFAPPVGHAGTTAISKDSAVFVHWATGCTVRRGYQDISNPALGFASVGDSTLATGAADNTGVVSLGDGGSATCTFHHPLVNSSGPDFAVFENGFDDTFLELAFVEVSSDGTNFFRFPARSLTDTVTQTSSFDPTDATKINNLAGKYRGGYGTPFDLQELANMPGLNVNAITHIKIVDVVGSLNKLYATYDSQQARVNDPWPTAYPSGGFDLDAIGVIYDSSIVGIEENSSDEGISFYPNPVMQQESIRVYASQAEVSLQLMDLSGKTVRSVAAASMETTGLPAGMYLLKIISAQRIYFKKICIQ